MDLGFQLWVHSNVHRQEQASVIGDAELLCAVPEVFLHVIGDFGIEEELDGCFLAAAVDAEAVAEGGFEVEISRGSNLRPVSVTSLIRKRAKVCGSSSGCEGSSARMYQAE